MLVKGAQRIKTWFFGPNIEHLMLDEFRHNPLAGYLQVYFEQHRMIAGLYRVLVTAFLSFVLLVSLMIYNSLGSSQLPTWGFLALGLADILLLLGGVKVLKEIRRYRLKSQAMLAEVYEQLKRDLNRFEKIKDETGLLASAQKMLKKKLRLLQGDGNDPPTTGHSGWDAQFCETCGHKVEMLEESCPACGLVFEENRPN